MSLKAFIENNEVTSTTRLIDEATLIEAEKIIGITFGNQLKEYILTYGYLSYKFAELYGINSNQKIESDLVRQTLYLHKYFPIVNKYIAIENQGDGDYYVVDSSDHVFEFDSDLGELSDTGFKLFDYILDRFDGIKNL
ncbi:MAG: SMI1/KNR4 family protein [Butyrivibrio sp.]|uniref:SMI1/KNR4 family protein n=1 Tax=Butyrivibrio sp. TaxID=28121 RepID=UPI0025F679D5|nr:SMI1/KNR4 family protein [Butyrivibrio sp.]MCR5772415.1 SMI1/KNR4 family protein [Butyrivibrio sp.]